MLSIVHVANGHAISPLCLFHVDYDIRKAKVKSLFKEEEKI